MSDYKSATKREACNSTKRKMNINHFIQSNYSYKDIF